MSLKKNLEKWKKAGLISKDQLEKIKSYEDQKSDWSWIVNGILIVATTSIIIGIAALIASRWHKIPDALKLNLNWLLLLSLALCIYKNNISGFHNIFFNLKKYKNFLHEVLLFVFLLALAGSVSLISHIYYTGGFWYQALLFCSVIGFPAVLFSRGFVVTSTWAIVFSFVVLQNIESLLNFRERWLLVLIYPSVCYLLSYFFGRFKNKIASQNLSTIFMNISLILFLFSMLQLDTMVGIIDTNLDFIVIFSFLCVTSGLAWIVAMYKDDKIKSKIQSKIPYFYPMIPLLYGITLLTIDAGLFRKFIGGAFFIFTLSVFAFDFSLKKKRRWFNFFLSLIGLRFLIFYCQALAGFVTTGLGFISFGVLILFLFFLFRKLNIYEYIQKRQMYL